MFSEKHPAIVCGVNKFESQEINAARTGWLYPKESMLQKPFDKFLLTQYEAGIGKVLNVNYFDPPLSSCNSISDTASAISFELVTITFTCVAVGIVLSIVIAVMERTFFKSRLWKDHLKNDLRSDQDHRQKIDLRSRSRF
jgi:hypothetical protein